MRFLVIRAGNIGDVLMATPIARKLKNAFSGCTVDFVTSLHAKDVVQGNKNVDNVFIYRKYKRITKGIRKFFFERHIAKNKYDYCFVLEQHPQYHQLAKNVLGRHGVNIGFTSIPQTNYLDHYVEYDFLQQHAITNNLFLLRDFLNIPIQQEDYLMEFVIPNENIYQGSLPGWKGAEGKYVVIHPGCSGYLPLRAWVMDNYHQVIQFLRAQGYRVFLTGAKSDKHFIDEIAKGLDISDPGIEIFLDRHLYEVAFLIKHAAGILTIDTGIMHLARAMKTPVLALFGPSNPDHTGCIGPGVYVQIRNDFKCGPCHYFPQYRYEDKKYCLDGLAPACMKSISIEQVTDGLKKILGHE